jgi:hypothetical protein
MQNTAHTPAESVIDYLVLLDAAFAFEGGGNNVGGPMIVVAREVFQMDLGVGKAGFDHLLDIGRGHRHFE